MLDEHDMSNEDQEDEDLEPVIRLDEILQRIRAKTSMFEEADESSYVTSSLGRFFISTFQNKLSQEKNKNSTRKKPKANFPKNIPEPFFLILPKRNRRKKLVENLWKEVLQENTIAGVFY